MGEKAKCLVYPGSLVLLKTTNWSQEIMIPIEYALNKYRGGLIEVKTRTFVRTNVSQKTVFDRVSVEDLISCD